MWELLTAVKIPPQASTNWISRRFHIGAFPAGSDSFLIFSITSVADKGLLRKKGPGSLFEFNNESNRCISSS